MKGSDGAERRPFPLLGGEGARVDRQVMKTRPGGLREQEASCQPSRERVKWSRDLKELRKVEEEEQASLMWELCTCVLLPMVEVALEMSMSS